MKLRVLAMLFGLLSTVLVSPLALADDEVDTPDTEESADGVMSAAQEAKLALLADYVAGEDADDAAVLLATETVTALRETDLGWGAMFKLVSLAGALGEDPMSLLGEPGEDGEYSIGFGELKQRLTDEQVALLEDAPRNLGQLKKLERERDEAEVSTPDDGDAKSKKGKNPGRNKKQKTNG